MTFYLPLSLGHRYKGKQNLFSQNLLTVWMEVSVLPGPFGLLKLKLSLSDSMKCTFNTGLSLDDNEAVSFKFAMMMGTIQYYSLA